MSISFNPGPSRPYPQLRRFLQDAYDEGVLSMSHRSERFHNLYRSMVEGLREKLEIPADYAIYVTSSATETWAVLAEGATTGSSLHLYSGDFGRRWWEQTAKVQPNVKGIEYTPEDDLAELDLRSFEEQELVCLTHNETSNASQLPLDVLARIRERVQTGLLAVDATSSIAGVQLPIHEADIWFGSVQKAFGLPAGLCPLIVSPRAVLRFREIGFDGKYNSLVKMAGRYEKAETTHTPNVLGIYLLVRLMEELPPIAEIDQRTKERQQRYENLIQEHPLFTPLVNRPANRSHTVVGARADEANIRRVKAEAAEQGLLLGNGYGQLKASSFRIANFPALQDDEVGRLCHFLSDFR